MKTVSRIKAIKAGKYGCSNIGITIVIKTDRSECLARDEALIMKRGIEDKIVQALMEDTHAANITLL